MLLNLRECKQLSFSVCPFLCQRQIPIIANEVLRLLTGTGTVAEADNVQTFRLISKVYITLKFQPDQTLPITGPLGLRE